MINIVLHICTLLTLRLPALLTKKTENLKNQLKPLLLVKKKKNPVVRQAFVMKFAFI